MFRIVSYACILAVILGTSAAVVANAQDLLKPSMRAAAKELDALLPLMGSDKVFSDPKNEKVISTSLNGLVKNFNTLDSVQTGYHRQSGFDASLQLLISTLVRINEQFNSGKKSAALWQLRTVPNYCITCHISFNTKLSFDDKNLNLSGLTSREKGTLLFAVRNFSAARTAFWEAVNENNDSVERNDALRKWLVLSTRTDTDFSDSIQKLKELVNSKDLAQNDKQIIEDWISDLESWQTDPRRDQSSVDLAASLITEASAEQIEDGVDTTAVKVLRATRMLNQLLESGKVETKDRARALLLLGRGYILIPLYLFDGLGKMYLEQVIIEAPSSKEANRAYQLYEQQTLLEYSGSGGTFLPDDEKKRLSDLKARLK